MCRNCQPSTRCVKTSAVLIGCVEMSMSGVVRRERLDRVTTETLQTRRTGILLTGAFGWGKLIAYDLTLTAAVWSWRWCQELSIDVCLQGKAHVQTCMHAYTLTHTCMWACARLHTHTHIHTYTQARRARRKQIKNAWVYCIEQ